MVERVSIAARAARIYWTTIPDDSRDWFWCGHFVMTERESECAHCRFAQVAALECAGQVDPSLEVN